MTVFVVILLVFSHFFLENHHFPSKMSFILRGPLSPSLRLINIHKRTFQTSIGQNLLQMVEQMLGIIGHNEAQSKRFAAIY
jgi:hypothetical protein